MRLLTLLLANGGRRLYPPRRAELARAARHDRLVGDVRRAVRPGAGHSVDAAGADAGAEGACPSTGHSGYRSWIPHLNLTVRSWRSQISMLLLLLTGASLFRADAVEPPVIPARFQSRQPAAVRFECSASGVSDASASPRSIRTCGRRMSEIPGVRAVTLSQLFAASAPAGPFDHDRRRRRRQARASCKPDRGFFSSMQIPMLQGREIDERDRLGTPPVAVISDLFARTFFPGQNPLGRHIRVVRRPEPAAARSGNCRRRRDRAIRPPQVRRASAA